MIELEFGRNHFRVDLMGFVLWGSAIAELFWGQPERAFAFALLATLGGIARAIDDLKR